MKEKNPKILNDFLNCLLIQNYSKGTISEYNCDLLNFFNFLIKYFNLKISTKDITVFILISVKKSDIIAFLVFLNYNRNNCFKTRQRKMASIKTFYKWLFVQYPSLNSKENPAKSIPYIEPAERLPKHLKLDDAKKLQHIFNKYNSKNYIRDNAIITLFLNCGLRLSELIGIDIKNVDLDKKSIRIIGKGNKERIIYLNKISLEIIKKYLSTRKTINLEEPLFVSNRNKRFSRRGIEKICENAFKLANLEEYGFTTHTLRHTAATYIYKSTKDLLITREFLGHANITSTQIYLHVDNEAVKRAVNSNPLSNYKSEKVAA